MDEIDGIARCAERSQKKCAPRMDTVASIWGSQHGHLPTPT